MCLYKNKFGPLLYGIKNKKYNYSGLRFVWNAYKNKIYNQEIEPSSDSIT